MTTSPVLKDVISAIGFARPFRKCRKIVHEHVFFWNAGQNDFVAIDFITDLVPRPDTEREANGAGNGGLGLSSDASDNLGRDCKEIPFIGQDEATGVYVP